ncbi:MAG: hypothetical protein IKU30_04790 [Clostridia bacterium]|nr:hypothetical protein [Clostridia bacterium]
MNNQVESVRLYVDLATGELKAVYPDDYEGSTFAMNGNALEMTTPDGYAVPMAYMYKGVVYASSEQAQTANNLFSEYIKVIKRGNYKKLVRLDFLQPDGTVAFSLGNLRKRGYMRKYDTRAFIETGNLNVNMQNGQRRTATITLADLDDAFNFNINNVWFGQQLRLLMGVILDDGSEYYLPQGVFYVKNPTKRLNENTKTITYNLVDKWGYLNGELFGKLEGTYQVPKGNNTNIFSAIQTILELSKYDFSATSDVTAMIDSTTPVFTSYYNGKTYTLSDGTTAAMTQVPYTITSKANGSFADVILELNSIVAGVIGYDQTGALRIEPSQDDIDDSFKPILWEFSPENSTLSALNETYKDTDVYNDIIIAGTAISGSEVFGRATNYDLKSDTNVFAIGKKTYRDTQANYWNNEQCIALAKYRLKRSAVLSKTVSITSQQMFHLMENRLVSVKRTDKAGSPTEQHIIQSFTLPLGDTGSMTINATSVMDLPAITTGTVTKTQLQTPVLLISGSTLTISNIDTHAAMIMLYSNGSYLDQILFPQQTSLPYDLSALSLPDGSYTITAIAGADASSEYTPSETSNAVVYTVSTPQLAAPTISISVNTLTVTAEAAATTYQVYIDNVAVGNAVSIGTTTNLASLGITGGTHSVTATVSASGYITSAKSSASSWLVPTITGIYSHCSSNNNATYAYLGTSYSATITPSSSYTFDGGTFSMTMGGVEASSSYTYDSTNDRYVISVASVSGDIGIGAVASAVPVTYTVTKTASNATIQGADTINEGTYTSYNITSNYGYYLPDTMIVNGQSIGATATDVGGATARYDKQDDEWAILYVSNVYTNITMSIGGIAYYSLTTTLSNATLTSVSIGGVTATSPYHIKHGQGVLVTMTADSNYEWQSGNYSASMGGSSAGSFTVSSSSLQCYITSATGNIAITATATSSVSYVIKAGVYYGKAHSSLDLDDFTIPINISYNNTTSTYIYFYNYDGDYRLTYDRISYGLDYGMADFAVTYSSTNSMWQYAWARTITVTQDTTVTQAQYNAFFACFGGYGGTIHVKVEDNMSYSQNVKFKFNGTPTSSSYDFMLMSDDLDHIINVPSGTTIGALASYYISGVDNINSTYTGFALFGETGVITPNADDWYFRIVIMD